MALPQWFGRLASVAQRRFQATLVIVFAASALLVASLGIYGVVAYSVARRRNDIGIRMALGAQRSQVLGLVIRQCRCFRNLLLVTTP
jgi:ABC-type antimicrobial peptide transport system permease subunit